MNGHGMTCHAGSALATAELVLPRSTQLDVSAVMGHPAKLDFSILSAGRFEQDKALDFDLKAIGV